MAYISFLADGRLLLHCGCGELGLCEAGTVTVRCLQCDRQWTWLNALAECHLVADDLANAGRADS